MNALLFAPLLGCLLMLESGPFGAQASILSVVFGTSLLFILIYLHWIKALYGSRLFRALTFLTLLLLGFAWSSYCWNKEIAHIGAESATVLTNLKVKIASREEITPYGKKARVEVLSSHLSGAPYSGQGAVILYYPDSLTFKPGELWLLTKAKAKPFHGYASYGAFSRETWALSQKLSFSLSLKGQATRLASGGFSLTRWVEARIDLALANGQESGDQIPRAGNNVIRGLLLGDRSQFDRNDWQLLQSLGLSHLMAVSGLHIGIMFSLGFLIGELLGKGLQCLSIYRRYIPDRHWASLAVGLMLASFYAGLTGWGVPAQRAFLMLLIAAFAGVFWPGVSAFRRLLLACLGVWILWPFSLLSASFWLSAYAVLVLVWVFSGKSQMAPRLYGLVLAQVAMTLCLMPLSALFFQQASLVGPLLNFVLIPLVSFVVLPVLLLLACSACFFPAVAHIGFDWLGCLLDDGWQWGQVIANWSLSSLHWQLQPVLLLILLSVSALLWAFAPKGTPGRKLALVAVLPLFFLKNSDPALNEGEWLLGVLDIGQGSAAVLVTRTQTLLIDTGPGNEDYSAAEQVIGPYLQHYGRTLDRVVVSHNDQDHSGGVSWLAGQYHPLWFLGQPLTEPLPHPRQCHGEWNSDGVEVHLLQRDLSGNSDDNSHSCVVLIRGASASALLPGDLSANDEKALIEKYPDQLDAVLLVASHHGSRTGSSDAFLAAVKPQFAAISAGYLNQFGHPHLETLQRFYSRGVKTYNTATLGTLEFVSRRDQPLEIKAWREQQGYFWEQVFASGQAH
ncbi:DNA internalization-related competence protein ComEC/Rec2 [Pokkaliibacter sp. CJK22405]|uniref:DNA internalization-related competence protein ComEC/Rec2 n=1 Tax=Pokkaliibacter sp. CJK22405 TaxID=3384615 RepID=UPI003984695E